jgi:transposase
MTDQEDLEAKMRAELEKQSEDAAIETDEMLSEELDALKKATAADMESLKPKITDKGTYDKLIDAVKESTDKNESLAQLETRLKTLGTTAIKVAKEAVKLLKGF